MGKGACASAANNCKGHNTCKGKGWLEVTEKECKDKKGTVLVEKKQDAKPAPKPTVNGGLIPS
jgi:hypothetical protein